MIEPNEKLILVIVESPYAGTKEITERNVKYAQLCMADCLRRKEAPYASHLLYTQAHVLDDGIIEERNFGIEAGLQWGEKADKTVVYEDFGYSGGMKLGIERAKSAGRPVELRKLPKDVFAEHFPELIKE